MLDPIRILFCWSASGAKQFIVCEEGSLRQSESDETLSITYPGRARENGSLCSFESGNESLQGFAVECWLKLCVCVCEWKYMKYD